jgi:hypothetical protein
MMTITKQIGRRRMGAALSIDEAGKAVGVPGTLGEPILRSDIESYNAGLVSSARRAPHRARIEAENAARLEWFDRQQAERQREHQVDRRAVLTGATLATAAAAVVAAVPVVAMAAQTDDAEILDLYRQWAALFFATYPTDEAANEATEQRSLIEDRIFDLRATSGAAMAAKLRLLQIIEDSGNWLKAPDAFASLLADMEGTESPSRSVG